MSRSIEQRIANNILQAISLRTLRNEHHLTLPDTAHALSTWPARIYDIETARRPLPELTEHYRQYLANA